MCKLGISLIVRVCEGKVCLLYGYKYLCKNRQFTVLGPFGGLQFSQLSNFKLLMLLHAYTFNLKVGLVDSGNVFTFSYFRAYKHLGL